MSPIYIGCLCSRRIRVRMTVAAEKMPVEPDPAITLPMINAVELGAAPHRAEPTSKSRISARKTILVL